MSRFTDSVDNSTRSNLSEICTKSYKNLSSEILNHNTEEKYRMKVKRLYRQKLKSGKPSHTI